MSVLDILYVGMLPPHPGGSAISAAQLLAGFARRGHSVRALAPITEAQLKEGDPFATCEPSISIERFLVPAPYTASYRPAPEAYRSAENDALDRLLPSLIAARRPDVIFIGRESFAWRVPGIAASLGVPSVLRAAGATTAGIVEGTYPPHLAAQLIEHCRRVQLVITPSKQQAMELRRLGLERVIAIPNAIDLDVFQPRAKDAGLLAELGIDDDDVVIAFLGNFNDRKRPLDVVRSSAQVLARCPGVVFLMVGEGQLWDEAIVTAQGLGVADRFRFVGWQTYDMVPSYLNLADIVVLPSFGEGLARVYLETQACGRVLIASDIAAAREVVIDGETGSLFPVGDVARLAERSIEAARDPALRMRIGRAARERVVQQHDIGRATARYLDAIGAVARGTPPERADRPSHGVSE